MNFADHKGTLNRFLTNQSIEEDDISVLCHLGVFDLFIYSDDIDINWNYPVKFIYDGQSIIL